MTYTQARNSIIGIIILYIEWIMVKMITHQSKLYIHSTIININISNSAMATTWKLSRWLAPIHLNSHHILKIRELLPFKCSVIRSLANTIRMIKRVVIRTIVKKIRMEIENNNKSNKTKMGMVVYFFRQIVLSCFKIRYSMFPTAQDSLILR